MANREIKTKLTLEGEQQYQKAMTSAANAIKTLSAEERLAAAQFDATGDAEAYAAEQTRILKEKLEEQRRAVSAAEAAVKSLTDNGVSKNDKAMQKWRTKLANARTTLITLEKKVNSSETELAEQGTEFDATATEAGEYREAIETAAKSVDFSATISAIDNIRSAIATTIKAVVKMGKALIEAEVGGGQWADQLTTAASQAGLDVETYQAWQYASRFIDTSVDDIVSARKKLAQNLSKKGTSLDDVLVDLNKLNVPHLDMTTGKMRQTEDVLWDVIDALGQVDDMTLREELAMSLLGKSYDNLNPLITAGSKAYKDLVEEGRSVAVVSADNVAALAEYDDANQKLDATFTKTKETLLAEMAPAFTRISEAMTNALAAFNEFLETEEGQKALENLNSAVGGFADVIESVDFQDALDKASGLVTGFTAGLKWIGENATTVALGLAGLGIAWAGLTVSKEVLSFLQLINGLSFAKAAKTIGTNYSTAANAASNAANAASSASNAASSASNAASSASNAASSASNAASSASAAASSASSSAASATSAAAAETGALSAESMAASNAALAGQGAAQAMLSAGQASAAASQAMLASGANMLINGGASALLGGAMGFNNMLVSGLPTLLEAQSSALASEASALAAGAAESATAAAASATESAASASSAIAAETGAQAAEAMSALNAALASDGAAQAMLAASRATAAANRAALTSIGNSLLGGGGNALLFGGGNALLNGGRNALTGSTPLLLPGAGSLPSANAGLGSKLAEVGSAIKNSVLTALSGAAASGALGTAAVAAVTGVMAKALDEAATERDYGEFNRNRAEFEALAEQAQGNDQSEQMESILRAFQEAATAYERFDNPEDPLEAMRRAFAENAEALYDLLPDLSIWERFRDSGVADASNGIDSDEIARILDPDQNGMLAMDWIDLGVQVVNGLSDGIRENAATATESAGDMAQGVADAITSTLDIQSPSGVAYADGENVAIGLANGINDRAGVAIAAAAAMAAAVNATLRSVLDIHSPSRVAAGFGEMYGEGFAIGIEDTADRVRSAVDRMIAGTTRAPVSGRDSRAGYGAAGGNQEMVHITIVADGRHLADIITPYVNNSIAVMAESR